MPKEKYWALSPSNEIVHEVEQRIEQYYMYLEMTGRLDIWRQAYQQYNLALYRGTTLRTGTGTQGKFTGINVNHWANILQHLLTMTINQRPAFEPRAVNSDVESQSQAILARGLLEYYLREKRMERNLKSAVEFALLYGEGFMTTTWDATSGKTYGIDPETKIERKEGDVLYKTYQPIDVIRDPAAPSSQDNSWYITRDYQNRYDLMAKYPELADDILSETVSFNPAYEFRPIVQDQSESDLVPVYTLMHDRTDAVPNGREVVIVGFTMLTDGPLPYRNLPVFRVCGRDVDSTPFGYSTGFDLLPLQDAIDVLYSTIATNQTTYGVQHVLVPRGSNIEQVSLGDGMNVIEYDQGTDKPSPMNFTHTPAEVFTHLRNLIHDMETISGVNSVARGNPEHSLKSGAALALVQSMAIQFNQGLQHSYVQLMEDVGTATVNVLRDYANVPRIAMISGKANKGMMKEFTGKDLSQINRVQVDVGNPLSRTTAGKVQMAETLLQAKLLESADQYIQVMQTGNLDPLIEGKTIELLAIKSENEHLADGQHVFALLTDLHQLHINEHKCVVADPVARSNPEIVQTVNAHILEHYKFLSDPQYATLLALMGQKPVPEQPQGAPQGGGAPMQQQAPTGTNELVEQNMPGLPSAPKNALTNQPAQLPPGAAIHQ